MYVLDEKQDGNYNRGSIPDAVKARDLGMSESNYRNRMQPWLVARGPWLGDIGIEADQLMQGTRHHLDWVGNRGTCG